MTEEFIGKVLVSKMAGRQISGGRIKHFGLTCWGLQLWSVSSRLPSGSAEWTSDIGYNY